MAMLTIAPDVASRPLMAWLTQEFEPRARVGDWELRMRRDMRPAVVYGARWIDGSIAVTLPSIGHEAVARIAVVDVGNDRTLGDSARRAEVVVRDDDGAALDVDAGLDVSRRRSIVVRLADASSSDDQSIAVRLWARDGRSLAIQSSMMRRTIRCLLRADRRADALGRRCARRRPEHPQEQND